MYVIFVKCCFHSHFFKQKVKKTFGYLAAHANGFCQKKC